MAGITYPVSLQLVSSADTSRIIHSGGNSLDLAVNWPRGFSSHGHPVARFSSLPSLLRILLSCLD